jgi:hypothetical protein
MNWNAARELQRTLDMILEKKRRWLPKRKTVVAGLSINSTGRGCTLIVRQNLFLP